MTLLAAPEDRVALRYLLQDQEQTWLAKQYQVIREQIEQSGEEPWSLLEQLAFGTSAEENERHCQHNFVTSIGSGRTTEFGRRGSY